VHLHHLGDVPQLCDDVLELRLVHLRLHEHRQRIAERGGVQTPVVALQRLSRLEGCEARLDRVPGEPELLRDGDDRGPRILRHRQEDAAVGVIDDVHSARSYGTVARIVEHCAPIRDK